MYCIRLTCSLFNSTLCLKKKHDKSLKLLKRNGYSSKEMVSPFSVKKVKHVLLLGHTYRTFFHQQNLCLQIPRDPSAKKTK